MALIKCPECGRQVSDRAIECPGCGYPIRDNIVESVSDETKVIEQIPEKSDNSRDSQNDISDRSDSGTDESEKTIANEDLYTNEESSDTVTDNINSDEASEESGVNENTDDRKNNKRFIIISSVVLAVVALVLVFVFVILPKISGSKEEQNDTNSSSLDKNSDVNEEQQRKYKELEIHGKSVYTAAQSIATKFYAKNMVPSKSENVQEYCRQVYEISEINQNKNAIAYIRFKSLEDSGRDAYTVDEIIYSDDGDTYLRFYNGNWDHFDKSDLIGYGAPEWIIINANGDFTLSKSTPTPTLEPTPTSTPIPTATPSPIPTSAPEYKIDTSNSDEWAAVYLKQLLELQDQGYEYDDKNIYDADCRLVYIDGDDIPELYVNFCPIRSRWGFRLYTICQGSFDMIEIHDYAELYWVAGSNKICAKYGYRTDNQYYDLFVIEKGKFKQLVHIDDYYDFDEGFGTKGWYIDSDNNKYELADDSLYGKLNSEFDWNNAEEIGTLGVYYTYGECVEFLKSLARTSDYDDNSSTPLSEFMGDKSIEQSCQYLLYNSNYEVLKEEDLFGFSKEECRLARNEIYARHGRIFKDSNLQNYFNSKTWYLFRTKVDEVTDDDLNDCEKANLDLILTYEESELVTLHKNDKKRNIPYKYVCFYDSQAGSLGTYVEMLFDSETSGVVNISVSDEDGWYDNADGIESYCFEVSTDLELYLFTISAYKYHDWLAWDGVIKKNSDNGTFYYRLYMGETYRGNNDYDFVRAVRDYEPYEENYSRTRKVG